jgi:hypothetical protein
MTLSRIIQSIPRLRAERSFLLQPVSAWRLPARHHGVMTSLELRAEVLAILG